MIYNWDVKELKKRRRYLLKLLFSQKYNTKDKKEIMEDFEGMVPFFYEDEENTELDNLIKELNSI